MNFAKSISFKCRIIWVSSALIDSHIAYLTRSLFYLLNLLTVSCIYKTWFFLHFHKHTPLATVMLFPFILTTFWHYLLILSLRDERELGGHLGQEHPSTVQTSCPKSCCRLARQSAWDTDRNLNPSSSLGLHNSFYLKQRVCWRKDGTRGSGQTQV